MLENELILPSSKLRKTFTDLVNLFKGRETDKVFQLKCKDGILKLQASTVIVYETILTIDILIRDFNVVCSFKDLSLLLLGNDTKITIMPTYVSFQSDGVETGLNTSYAIVEVFDDTSNYNLENINCTEMVDCFNRLKKLTTIYNEFPAHQSVHCKSNYAYIITPIAYIYIRGCPIETTIDRSTADFISYFCNKVQAVEIGYSSRYLKLHNGDTTILIPKVETFNDENNKLLKTTTKVCSIEVEYLKFEINKIKSRYPIMLSFQQDILLVEINTVDFKYLNRLNVKSLNNRYVVTDALFLYTVLELFNKESIIEIREGDGLLILQTERIKVFLSCLS